MTGGCQCGAVRYALYSEPTRGSICHCRMCQKALGNYFAPFTGVPPADLVWTRGEPGVFKSSELVERGLLPRLRHAAFVPLYRLGPDLRDGGQPRRPARRCLEMQYGIESRLPAFATLHTLPGGSDRGRRAARADWPASQSRQHPDHD